MVRPLGWDVIGLDGDPTPGVVESVQALAKEFGDFAHDVESAYRSLNSFGSDTTAMKWVGQTADSFKGQYGPLPGRLQKLYTSYSEASDALSAYAPALQAAQSKADSALRQAQDANVDLQRATTNANSAAADLKTAQQNHAASPNPQAVTDAQTAHDTAQTNLNNAKAKMAALTKQANDAYNDRIAAAKTCASALHKAQGDGIHNKSWWDHVAEDLSEWGGKIAEIANDLAPFLDVLALATSWIPGVDVVTAALAEADNIVAMVGTGMEVLGDAMQGHWSDALMGAGMLGLTLFGGKAIEKFGGAAIGKLAGKFGKEAEEGAADTVGAEARSADGVSNCSTGGDPVDLVSGEMVTAEIDLELAGVLPVVLRRTYASGYDTGRLFGPGWSSTFDQRISVNDAGIHFAGDDGQVLHYALHTDGQQVLPVRGARWPLTWDHEADEIRITDPWSGCTWHFPDTHYRDEFGQIRDLVAITDRNHNEIRILRDQNGTPTGLEHPGYRVTVDTVVTAGGPRIIGMRLLDGSDGGSHTIKQYKYDRRGRLVGVINSSGLPFTYEWDDADRITAWVDRVGYRYVYEYGPDGRVIRGIGDGGFLSASFEYRDDEKITVLTNALGQQTRYRYDENGHVVAVVDALGNTTLTQHDLYGRLLSHVDASGGRTVYERDERGNPYRIIDPDGAITEFAYNVWYQVETARLADGTIWRRAFDDRGNLVEGVDPTGATVRFDYAANGSIERITDPIGATTTYRSNTAGLPTESVDPIGAATQVTRDAFGRLVQVTDPLGGITTYGWSIEGRPTWRVTADGARTEWAYDAEERLVRTVDAIGAESVVEPGPFNLVMARTGPDGVRYEFDYDDELNLRSVTNPAAAVWQYAYDSAGRLVGETDFNGRTLGYELDPAGRLATLITGLGDRIAIVRDRVGRIVSRITPDTEYAYGYDLAGRLVSADGAGKSLNYSRDELGRIVAENVDGRTTVHEFDAAGRRISRTTPSGAVSDWAFDLAGRPASLHAGDGQLHFEFDLAGRETNRAIGELVGLAREHDVVGRLTAQHLTARTVEGVGGPIGLDGALPAQPLRSVLGRRWAWRGDDVPLQVTDSLRGTRSLTTDAAGRITAVSGADWSETYAYDVHGNVVDFEVVGAGSTADARGTGQRVFSRTLIRAAGRTQYVHDAAGRLVRTVRRTLDGRQRVWGYTWDAEDRLVRTSVPDGSVWSYTYDPLGRRISKSHVRPDGSTSQHIIFVWDGPVLAEQHSYDDVLSASSTVLTWDYEPESFTPAAQRRRSWAADAAQAEIDGVFHAIVTDLVGTPTELVDSDGRIAWYATTSLWGTVISSVANAGDECPLRFPGQYHDAETGLHYNVHRYYDPDTGVYLTPDPLGLGPASNDRAYVPNPLTLTDPLGLMCPRKAPRSQSSGRPEPSGAPAESSSERGLWQLTDDGSTAVMKGGPFKTTFYKSASDGTWWTRDVTGHGQSAFKVYREGSKGLDWIADADKYGDYMPGKHKGDTGLFIPWSKLKKV